MNDSPRTLASVADTSVSDASLEQAIRVLEVPSFELLSLLTAAEIMELRDKGRRYFELVNFHSAASAVASADEVVKQFSSAAVEYWEYISEHLATRHSGITQKPTKLALLLQRVPGHLLTVPNTVFSVAMDVGAAVGEIVQPVAGAAKQAIAETSKLLKTAKDTSTQGSKVLKLRFLLFADTAEMRRLREAFPDRSWFAKKFPEILDKTLR